MRTFNPPTVPGPSGGYSHGVAAAGEFLFVSGQTPEAPDGSLAAEPHEQLRQVWANVAAVLRAAGGDLGDLVHVRTYLAGREHRGANTEIRREVLGGHEPALTVVICELFDEGWVAEIEAVAALPG